MPFRIHIDGPVHYAEPNGARYMLPLGPCSAELHPAHDAVQVHWLSAAERRSAALPRAEFEALQREGRILTFDD